MKYLSFSLENYKGIENKITLDIDNDKALSCLVGDNESGKTTILQGINLIGRLCKGGREGNLSQVDLRENRPRGVDFSGDIIFSAKIKMENEEITDSFREQELREQVKKNNNTLSISFIYNYQDQASTKKNKVIIKTKESSEEIPYGDQFSSMLTNKLPEIIYYEDFDFQVPQEIKFLKPGKKDTLTAQKKNKNKKWQNIFDDILTGALNDGTRKSFQKLIVDWNSNDQMTADNRILRMKKYLDKEVARNWKDINGKKTRFDEFSIKQNDESNYKDYSLQIVSGETFKISEKSKGAQWYFCFKIYTEVRKNRDRNGTIFLLDEPASNLHIYPQREVLKSLIDLTSDNISVLYSTHSPFLIDLSKTKNIYVIDNLATDIDSRPVIQCSKLNEYDILDDSFSIEPIINSIFINASNLEKDKAKKFLKNLKQEYPKVLGRMSENILVNVLMEGIKSIG